jgi:hypothetical protein
MSQGISREEARSMRIGRWDIRPLGGGVGCLTMIVISVVASILLTALLNVCVSPGN